MTKNSSKTQDAFERLKFVKHNGVNILLCDFSSCTREEGGDLLAALVKRLEKEADASVRLFFDVSNTTHDASMSNEWKRHLDLFDQKLKKSAIVGLSRLNRIALAGIRTYAGLMGHSKTAYQTQVFESRDLALDYLSSEK
jgi:hypothetical protein